jgi:hypothetical protein
MGTQVRIEDHFIWFKHVDDPYLLQRLRNLRDEEVINLEAGGVVGRWKRMKTGKDGRPTDAIKPEGEMKRVWNDWFRAHKGRPIELREAVIADDYLAAGSKLFASEWNSPEDEEAFRDL